MKQLLETLEKNIRQEIEIQLEVQANLDRQLDILLQGGTEKIPELLEGAEQSLAQSGKFEDDRAMLIRQIATKLATTSARTSAAVSLRRAIHPSAPAAAAPATQSGSALSKMKGWRIGAKNRANRTTKGSDPPLYPRLKRNTASMNGSSLSVNAK